MHMEINTIMDPDFSIDLDAVRAYLRNKEDKRQKELHTRWIAARNDFEKIISAIIKEHNPDRIYQWGSLLDFSRFSEISDIDIALEGLSGPEEYFAILGTAMQLTGFPLDIIELDKLDPDTASHIKAQGKLIYER